MASPEQEGAGSSLPGQLRTRSSAISPRGLAGRLVLGYVELTAPVEPLLLTKDVGGHRLAPADL